MSILSLAASCSSQDKGLFLFLLGEKERIASDKCCCQATTCTPHVNCHSCNSGLRLTPSFLSITLTFTISQSHTSSVSHDLYNCVVFSVHSLSLLPLITIQISCILLFALFFFLKGKKTKKKKMIKKKIHLQS